jgi:transposase-like protein
VTIELPPPDTTHWTARRKAAVVEAVRTGMISVQEACLRYGLSIEEFLSWLRTVEQHGIYGLRATRVQIYRDKGPGLAKK